jgi:hypothetical protein
MTTKARVLHIIRAKCIDCCCGNRKEVALCTCIESCPLHPYRFGKDPKPSETRGFAKPPDYTGGSGQEIDPPPKEKTPNALQSTRGENKPTPNAILKRDLP